MNRPRLASLLRRPESIAGNSLRLLAGGPAFYPAMLDAIAGARSEVLVATYLWESDAFGRRVIAALRRAARRGAAVHVLLDAVGGRGLSGADRYELQRAGAQLALYHPISYPGGRWFRRLHKKLLLVDGERAFTGGAGFADGWLAEPPAEWWDLMVEVTGPVLALLRRDFASDWRRQAHSALPAAATAPQDRGEETLGMLVSRFGRPKLRRRLHRAVKQARRRIDITSAYFVPGRRLRKALAQAAEHGVRVRLLLPGARTDHEAVRHAGRRHYARLLACGVEIHEWQRGVLHAKYAVVDDDWAYVGSSNLDNWSLRFNAELDLTLSRGAALDELSARFETDLESSRRIDLERWRDRPLALRLAETFFGWFDPLL